jgi:hypothetical protein
VGHRRHWANAPVRRSHPASTCLCWRCAIARCIQGTSQFEEFRVALRLIYAAQTARQFRWSWRTGSRWAIACCTEASVAATLVGASWAKRRSALWLRAACCANTFETRSHRRRSERHPRCAKHRHASAAVALCIVRFPARCPLGNPSPTGG